MKIGPYAIVTYTCCKEHLVAYWNAEQCKYKYEKVIERDLRIETPIRIDTTTDKVTNRGTTSAGVHCKYKPFTVLIHDCPNQSSNRQHEITQQQNRY